MVDVRLVTLIPPTPPVAQTSSAQTVTTQGGTIISQLPAGSLLSGFILNRDTNGNPILRTEKGDVPFSSNFFLKIGSEVVIRIQGASGQHTAHIVSVNGQPPEVAAEQSGFHESGDVIVGRNQQSVAQTTPDNSTAKAGGLAPSPPAPGQTISAIIVTPAAQTSASPALPPGTSLLLSVLTPAHQATQAIHADNHSTLEQLIPSSPLAQLTPQLPATTTDTLAKLLPTTPATPPLAQTTPAQDATIAPDKNPLLSQSTPFAASNQEAATAKLSGPLGQSFTATALVSHDDGSVLFDTPLGTLRAANLGSLPQGQQFPLRITSVANPNNYTIALANSVAPLPAAPLTELSRSWTSLQQIVQVLGEEATAQIIPTFSLTQPAGGNPQPAMQAGGQLLFFLSVLKGSGSLREWLGNSNVRALEEKGYGSLLKKAEGEFTSIARQFLQPQPDNWQSMYFPVMVSGEVQQVRAFIKREKKKNENGLPNGDEDTRFVVEMELSQLGEMQMDGLVKRKPNNLQFDLIIRSTQPLPADLERDIQQIYHSTAELTGYQGQMLFQTVASFPVHPLEDTTPHVFDDVVV